MKNKKFQKVIKAIQKFRDDRDWMQFHNTKDMAIAVAIEAAELQEHFLWKSQKEIETYLKDKNNREEVADEIADVLNFLIELADNIGIDVEKAFMKKSAKNAKKYPVEKAKGRHTKYTKL